MRRPAAPEEQVPVIPDKDLRRLVKAVGRTGFDSRRDTAMIRLLVDTGMPAAELINLRLADLDLDLDAALVMGKGRRPRACP